MKGFHIYLLTILIATVGLSACEKGLEPYHGDSSVYFRNNKVNAVDSGFLTFGFSDPSVRDSVISIPVSAMGMTSTSDRPFKLVVNDSSTARAGVHYEALSGTSIPAGAVATTIKLKLLRTSDMQTAPVSIILQLLPNEHFQTSVGSFSNGSGKSSATRFKLWITDIMTKPKYWDAGYMGGFSRKKVYLTASVLGLNVQEMIDILNGTDGTVAVNAQIAWGRSMKLYLNQQAAAGTPVREDDGSLMVMGNLI